MTLRRFVVPVLLAIPSLASAQEIPRGALQDSLIGWIKVYKFTGPRAPLIVDAKRYSPVQLSIMDSLANWMQASYTPKGALGDVIRMVSPKLNSYNQGDASLPQSYGVESRTYFQLKYDANHKIVPYTSDRWTWSVRANGVFGEPLLALNTPTQYYMVLPNVGAAVTPETQRYDFSHHPALKPFITYFNDQAHSSTVNATYVVLSKDNKFPFLKVTKGEYLDKLAEAVERKHEKEKDEAVKGWPEGKARASALKAADDRYQTRVSLMGTNRAKYAARLRETAEVFALQPDVLLENYKDAFEGSGGPGPRYPVYKVDPVMAELARTDQPQWILVWWDGDVLDPVQKHQIESILNNFDFQYVHDYFFAPEKVKGRPYRPLHSPDARPVVVVKEASEAARASAADAKVYLFEDFSTSAVGNPPNGWTIGRTAGTVATLDGLPGNWVLMAGEAKLAPKQLRTPLPANFTLTYDLVASKDFTWGAKAITLQLANGASYLSLRLRPGFDGRDGEATLETQFPAGYASGSKYLTAPGFSNNKANNRITVTIRKAGESLQVLIDGNKIAELDKAMPAGQTFNAMSFVMLGSPTELKDKYYIGNIRITRE